VLWATALALLPLSWALGKWIDEPLNAARRRSRRAVRMPAPALAEAA
jgi:peptidoglycan/LPS O-acetylase OafA/YrhL